MLTKEQLETRRKSYIGASEVAAIIGLTPKWRSAYDVWCEKTNRIDPSKVKESEAVNYGKLFESVILDWAAPRMPTMANSDAYTILKNWMVTQPNTRLAANLDSLIEFQKDHDGKAQPEIIARVPLEAKYSAMSDEWGDDGSSDVPVYYNVQLHAQMQVLGPDVREGFIALMLPGFRRIDMRLYRIIRDDKAAAMCQETADEFWDKYVQKDTPPPDCLPSVETLKALKRVPGLITKLDDADVTAFMQAKDEEKEIKEKVELRYRKIVTALGDAEGGESSYGIVTYREQSNPGYTVQPFKFRKLLMPHPKAKKSQKQLAQSAD